MFQSVQVRGLGGSSVLVHCLHSDVPVPRSIGWRASPPLPSPPHPGWSMVSTECILLSHH